MKGCDNWSGKAHWHTTVAVVIMTAFLAVFSAASAYAQQSESPVGQNLVLNVYLDNAGKALITGNAEDVSGLVFLNNSQFRFENDSHQLYALTDRLTLKAGDLWTLRFDAAGSFHDYRVTFYLPSETRLGEINASAGLGYLLSASNESLVADVQGYDVSDPVITIEYRQLLASNGSSLPPLPPPYPSEGAALIMLIVAAALLVAGFGFAVFLQRKKRSLTASPNAISGGASSDRTFAAPQAGVAAGSLSPGMPDLLVRADLPNAAPTEPSEASNHVDLSSPEDDGFFISQTPQESIANVPGKVEPSSSSALGAPSVPEAVSRDVSKDALSDALSDAIPDAIREDLSEQALSSPSPSPPEKDRDTADAVSSHPSEPTRRVIVVSSEMDAVMQTLTARERAVMSTLIEHGGRMTQADIRYETGTPKSSLTGILISLERRKLVSKKEWGRTNIIELSDWFLSKKEPS